MVYDIFQENIKYIISSGNFKVQVGKKKTIENDIWCKTGKRNERDKVSVNFLERFDVRITNILSFLQQQKATRGRGEASMPQQKTEWDDLRSCFSDLLWNEYCLHIKDSSVCAKRITENIAFVMKPSIAHTFSNPKSRKALSP